MLIRFAEQNFQRPSIKMIYKIDKMTFKINPKQLSDLLDFVKFQNYSLFYGINILSSSHFYYFI